MENVLGQGMSYKARYLMIGLMDEPTARNVFKEKATIQPDHRNPGGGRHSTCNREVFQWL